MVHDRRSGCDELHIAGWGDLKGVITMSAIYFKTYMKEMPKNCAECESRMYCHLPRDIGTTEGTPEYREKRHKNCPLIEDKNPIKIMNEDEFTAYLAEIKHELDYMEPGDGKRIALIGTVEGGRNLTPELAFTSSQLHKLFDLGFAPEE